MTTVTLCVASQEEVTNRALSAFKGQDQGVSISFASVDLLWQIMTRKRWELLHAMTGQGAISIREVARRLGRDVKSVHRDAHALLDAGILQRSEDGGIVFPFEAVHVDFTLVPSDQPA
ncbi:MAG: transcriptional regulator [Spiribacter salinus]|uniref:Transcriptional regulator n=1 Tax=Spiribacter salinus TaxID=1335746 RepID=A0A540VRM7_9GAMM|nr:MAG: transcriptional regulator [Spiribacter salinus]